MINLPSDAETAAALRALREQVKARRARLSNFGAGDGDDGASLAPLWQTVEEVNRHWSVNSNLPIASTVPGLGAVLIYAKRIVRRLLRWYIDPLVEQQNRFNSAAASALVEVFAHHERLMRDRVLLDERLERLEKKLMESGQEPR